MGLRLYIWENDRISGGYHNNGTLVVLAESPEQAREIALASSNTQGADDFDSDYWERGDIWRDARDDASVREAIERAPDRTIELTAPCVVAFNGGGYD